jgi:hypothetical protein
LRWFTSAKPTSQNLVVEVTEFLGFKIEKQIFGLLLEYFR